MLFIAVKGFGQQDPMFSQYMYNKMSINPGYAGAKGGLFGVLLHRTQWSGIEGAPTTQTFTAHTPFMGQKMGAGLNIVNDKIGVSQRLNVYGAYSYKLYLGERIVSFGVQGGFTRFGNNWSEIKTISPNDPSFSGGDESLFLPNVGAGVYYNDQKYFAGISMPYFLTHSLSSESSSEAQLYRHLFINGGGLFELNYALKLRPTILLKYVSGAPLQADLNMSVVIKDRFWPGLSYRTGDGLSAMFQVNLKNNLWMGYAYDYPFTELNGYTSGSHEIFISYTYFIQKPKVYSPRYF